MLRLAAKRPLAVILIVVGSVGLFRYYNDPARKYRTTNDYAAFLDAMEGLPLGTRRDKIERRLGPANSQLDSNMMLRYAIEFTNYQEGDEFIAYRLFEDGYSRHACMLRFRDDKLIGTHDFLWTPNYAIGGP